jgi:hypothetical protein
MTLLCVHFSSAISTSALHNGFELSRPARTLACFSNFPFKTHLYEIAPPAGSAAARACVKSPNSFNLLGQRHTSRVISGDNLGVGHLFSAFQGFFSHH